MFYLYKLVNKNQNVLYVGQTNNIKRRVYQQHFSNHGHLPDECYRETKYIYYMKCLSQSDLNIREEYLINTLSPPFNDRLNNKHKYSFSINDWSWEYLAKPGVKSILDEFENCKYKPKFIVYDCFCLEKQILTYDVIPTTSTLIHKNLGPDTYAVSVNNQIWIFFEHILDGLAIDVNSWPITIENVSKFIEKGNISIDDICVTTDKHLIHLNIAESDDWPRADHTVLVNLQGCINYLEALCIDDVGNDWEDRNSMLYKFKRMLVGKKLERSKNLLLEGEYTAGNKILEELVKEYGEEFIDHATVSDSPSLSYYFKESDKQYFGT